LVFFGATGDLAYPTEMDQADFRVPAQAASQGGACTGPL
jgi:hypothetical protein